MTRLTARLALVLAPVTAVMLGLALLAGRASAGDVLAFVAAGEGSTATLGDLVLYDVDRRTRFCVTCSTSLLADTAVWSPDGRRIAFRSLRIDSHDYAFSGLSGPVQPYSLPSGYDITFSAAGGSQRWSRDGDWLIHVVDHPDGIRVPYRVRADATVAGGLLPLDSPDAQDYLARLGVWQQGYRIAANGRYRLRLDVTRPDGRWQIVRETLATGDEHLVVDVGTTNTVAAYDLSPDGRTAAVIVEAAHGPDPRRDLLLIEAASGRVWRVVRDVGTAAAWRPRYAP